VEVIARLPGRDEAAIGEAGNVRLLQVVADGAAGEEEIASEPDAVCVNELSVNGGIAELVVNRDGCG